eukprot:3683123-Heterocapsa_arctica.AAC.1
MRCAKPLLGFDSSAHREGSSELLSSLGTQRTDVWMFRAKSYAAKRLTCTNSLNSRHRLRSNDRHTL